MGIIRDIDGIFISDDERRIRAIESNIRSLNRSVKMIIDDMIRLKQIIDDNSMVVDKKLKNEEKNE